MEQFLTSELLSKLNSPDGMRLMELLRKNGDAAFSKAVAAAKTGNYQLAKSILEPLLHGTQAQELAQKLDSQNG